MSNKFMDIAFIYIGLAQSLFSAFIIYFKKPRNIANRILGFWLLAIGGMFALNVVKLHYEATQDFWPISLTLSTSFPIFLYIYTKYVVSDYSRFQYVDYLHFVPLLVGCVVLVYFVPSLTQGIEEFKEELNNINSPNEVGYVFRLYIWAYCLLALIFIISYRRKIKNYFSFQSYKNSLNWLIFIIVSFLVIYNYIIYISTKYYLGAAMPHIEAFRSGALLLFVYIISFWGFKQNQLATNIRSPKLNFLKKDDESESKRYTKSGLSPKKAEQYALKLIDYMDHSEAWKNNELNVAALSDATDIPKHHITQVLNENIQKNFYTFVNEYRVKLAMEMIVSPKYDSLSFVGIAFESGFNSKTAFNIFFKKYTGMTPTEYKKKQS